MKIETEKFQITISEMRKIKSLSNLTESALYEIRNSLIELSHICYNHYSYEYR